jgi:hypothetical protein
LLISLLYTSHNSLVGEKIDVDWLKLLPETAREQALWTTSFIHLLPSLPTPNLKESLPGVEACIGHPFINGIVEGQCPGEIPSLVSPTILG